MSVRVEPSCQNTPLSTAYLPSIDKEDYTSFSAALHLARLRVPHANLATSHRYLTSAAKGSHAITIWGEPHTISESNSAPVATDIDVFGLTYKKILILRMRVRSTLRHYRFVARAECIKV